MDPQQEIFSALLIALNRKIYKYRHWCLRHLFAAGRNGVSICISRSNYAGGSGHEGRDHRKSESDGSCLARQSEKARYGLSDHAEYKRVVPELGAYTEL